MSGLSRTRTALMVAFLVTAWGISWPIYKVALNYSPPILFASLRCFIGGVLLLFVAIPRYRQMKLKTNWHIYVISAILNAVLFFGLQTIGLQYLPSGLFSVLVYLQPVLVGICAWLWLGESMSGIKVIGLITGFIGVACISMESISGNMSVAGIVFALATALSWAFGTVYTKKMGHRVDAVWLVALQFIIGGLMMMAIGTFAEHWSTIGWGHVVFLGSLAYGGLFGVAAAWLVYFVLVKSGEASKVAAYTFIVPLVAVLAGTIFLHEPFTKYLLLGIVMIVISITLVNRTSKRRPRLEGPAPSVDIAQ